MKIAAIFCTAAVIALTGSGCSQMPDTHDADVKALRDNETQWNQDFLSKDPEKVVAHYTDDAVLMTTGMPASSGKEAIRTTIKGMLSDPALSLKFQSSKVDVGKSGDVGYTQGSYTMVMTDPQTKQTINDHGSYVTTYRKQADGTWKAIADIATSEVPPPMPPPAAPMKKKH